MREAPAILSLIQINAGATWLSPAPDFWRGSGREYNAEMWRRRARRPASLRDLPLRARSSGGHGGDGARPAIGRFMQQGAEPGARVRQAHDPGQAGLNREHVPGPDLLFFVIGGNRPVRNGR